MKKIKKTLCLILLSALLIIPVPVTADDESPKEDIYVTLGGEAFGIKMYADGVYVLKNESFSDNNNKACCPAEDAGIEINDIIREVNDKKITSNEELKELIKNSEGEELELKIERKDELLTIKVTPVLSDQGKYQAGMWIKDSAAGLGTISFYSDEYNSFCGLGHGMIDRDTKELIPMTSGEAHFATVSEITKSSNGNVGTLNGYFLEDSIGTCEINADSGIYGQLNTDNLKNEIIELGRKEDAKRGNAKLYTTLDGDKPEYYDIEIIMIKKHDDKNNLIIKITDKRLLDKTGGIVQGMSGSPIVQDGKLVGVLTHVIVNNVDYGYGIFAETMYEKMEEIC